MPTIADVRAAIALQETERLQQAAARMAALVDIVDTCGAQAPLTEMQLRMILEELDKRSIQEDPQP